MILAVLLAAMPLGAQVSPPLANPYERLKESIRPSGEEIGYALIPWRPSLASAVEEARLRGMPVLLWTMNGHPLGST